MKTVFIEVEMTLENWIPVDAESLTDDHEIQLDPDVDIDILDGSSWWVDGDYSSPPKEIRVKTLKSIVASDEFLAEYLLGEHGEKASVWPDGNIGSVGSAEVDPNVEFFIVCPGLGNMDSGYFTEGWCHFDDEAMEHDDHFEGKYVEDSSGRIIGELEDVIRECIRDGDMTSTIEDMHRMVDDAVEEEERFGI